MSYQRGPLLAEGKTKQIFGVVGDDTLTIIESKDDVTAGDGARHDVIPGKGVWANTTTCNVFRLLQAANVHTAFKEQLYDTSFLANLCRMLPLEVVARREVHGSARKRMPHLPKGHVFPNLVVELYLKTSGRNFAGHELPCDDPLIQVVMGGNSGPGLSFELYDPKQPLWDQKPFLTLTASEVFGANFTWQNGLHESDDIKELLDAIVNVARRVFLTLEGAWRQVGIGARLVDFKIEFGLTAEGHLVVADVIDADSWRVVDQSGKYMDKQYYRDDTEGDLEGMARIYEAVSVLTGRFHIPHQQVVVWRGSDKDNTGEIIGAMRDYDTIQYLSAHGFLRIAEVTRSMHKQPELGLAEIDKLVQSAGQTVVIAYVGMSNGAGPTLAAHVTCPVISVPVNVDEHPEDVWSSMRCPSAVPNLTVLSPKNAALAALQILAQSNPAIYAALRLKQEERLTNFAPV